MKPPLKIVLPLAFGLLNLALMSWDLHNQRVIMSMGMAWDTGAPLWPSQTPDTLLFALNTPAFLVSAIGTNYFKFGLIGPIRYATFFPAILAWWWLVGWYLDKPHTSRKRPVQAILLCLIALTLLALGVDKSIWAVQWWLTYSRTFFSPTDLILLRLSAPSIWCFLLGGIAYLPVKRRISANA